MQLEQHHRQPHTELQRSYINCLAGDGGKTDETSCTATAHMVLIQDPYKVESIIKWRKIKSWDRDMLMHSRNFTRSSNSTALYIYHRMPGPYKGTPFRRIVHLNNAKPKFQLSDRDRQAQQWLKSKLATLHQVSQPDTAQTMADPPLAPNNKQSTSPSHQLQDPTKYFGLRLMFHISFHEIVTDRRTTQFTYGPEKTFP